LKKPAAAATPAKQKAASTPASDAKAAPAADKPLDKTQLFINSIKESVSVSELKTLYPKSKSIKMQKRKVGPTKKSIQFAFINFESEAECAEAFKAHTQIGGEKVNISYAFAQGKKPEQKPANAAAKKPEQKTPTDATKTKAAPANENAKKKEKKKPGSCDLAVRQRKTDVRLFAEEKQLSTNSIYVGQLPEHVVEDDIKASNKGVRPGFAFVAFADDSSAAAAIKLGPSLTLKNTQLKVAYQSKRPTAAE
jgi:RNA recognition motif-containing protein